MQYDEGSKQRRIDELLDDVRARLANGEKIDDHVIKGKYPELLPEFAIQLRMTIRIHNVKVADADTLELPEEARFDHLRKALANELLEYEIGELLGAGGQGAVFRASHKTLRRDVAIKVLIHGRHATKRQRERFLREVEISARMRHENIAIVYDCGIVDQCPYAVIEYVQGATLNDYLVLERPDITSQLRLIQQIAAGVNYAHQRGVIHRDLKPQNILINANGQPKIVDFGLAKSLADDGTQSVFSRADEVVGTVQYFSPEQASGDSGAVDVRTDVYGLGLIFYEILAGRLPYPVVTGTQALKDEINSTPPTPLVSTIMTQEGQRISRSNAKDIEAIVFKALEKRQQDRYQTVQELLDDLDRYFCGDPIEARAQTFFYVIVKLAQRHRKAVAVATSFVILLVTAAVVSTSLYFRATHQRDRAMQAVGFSQGIVDFLLSELDYDLSRLPGGSHLQGKLNQHLIEELARLQALQLNLDLSPASQARRAFNIGVIFHQLSKTEEAEEAFENAKALAEKAGADAATTEIATKIAVASYHEDEFNLLNEAAEQAGELIKSRPEVAEYRILRARALMRITKLAVKSHRLADAVEFGNQVLEIESAGGETEQLDRIQSETYRWLGTAYEAIGDCERAESLLEKALNQVNKILERQPADIRALQNRLQFRRSLADIYHRNGNIKDAERLLELAFKDAQLLETIEPTHIEIATDVLDFKSQLAFFAIRSDAIDASRYLALANTGVASAEARFESKPEILYQKARLAYIWYMYHQKKGDSEAASKFLRQAIDTARFVTAEYSTYDPIDSVLAMVLRQNVNILLDQRQLEDANVLANEVLSIRTKQWQRSPESLDLDLKRLKARYSLVRTQLRLGIGKPAVDEVRKILNEANALRMQSKSNCQTERIVEFTNTLEEAIRKLGVEIVSTKEGP